MLFRVVIWPCAFRRDWWWSVWSQLTSFRSGSAVVSLRCDFISPVVSGSGAIWFLSHRMNWFCFCCFFVRFLWGSQAFVMFDASRWEFKVPYMCVGGLRGAGDAAGHRADPCGAGNDHSRRALGPRLFPGWRLQPVLPGVNAAFVLGGSLWGRK